MKVSILIPAYNAELYISECLESAINQTYSELEIVVIDDGSTDNTFAIISEYTKIDPRIKAISRSNKGVAATRNDLLDNSTGDYIIFLDSDDWIDPEMIKQMMKIMTSNTYDIVMCDRKVETGVIPSNPIIDPPKIQIWEKDTILKKFMEHRQLTGSLWNKLVKRSLYKDVRFQPGIGYGEDAMVMWDILLKTSLMGVTNQKYYHYRLNPASISHQGFSNTKMSVIPVWNHITKSCGIYYPKLLDEAKARFGAEIILLILNAIKCSTSTKNANFQKLLGVLRKVYPNVIKSDLVSRGLKLTATGLYYTPSIILSIVKRW